jgi:HD superfamily phosphodiesterase
MRLSYLTPLINYAFSYVSKTTTLFNIDESHGLKHSMDVFHNANQIYNSEVKKNSYLTNQLDVIYVSAIVHDMCDKKYMNEKSGIKMMNNYMTSYIPQVKLDVISNIISTMSYSKVKKNGFPNLKEYQLAYHIVREADLLAAYDIERCIIYGMKIEKLDYVSALKRAIELFDDRVLKYRSDKLFKTKYSKDLSLKLHNKALKDIEILKTIYLLDNYTE